MAINSCFSFASSLYSHLLITVSIVAVVVIIIVDVVVAVVVVVVVVVAAVGCCCCCSSCCCKGSSSCWLLFLMPLWLLLSNQHKQLICKNGCCKMAYQIVHVCVTLSVYSASKGAPCRDGCFVASNMMLLLLQQ